jgi:hypothetical protein
MERSLILLLFLALCANAPAESSQAADLAKLKAKVMSADYRGDIPELARLRDELAHWPGESELSYVAHYWKGFASWRMAINGASRGMKAQELEKHLRDAIREFYVSLRAKSDFADAWAAASMTNSWLAAFTPRDGDEMFERLLLARALFDRAHKLDPDNPRVLWNEGSFLLFAPESLGGNIPRAIEIYEKMRVQAERRGTDAGSPLPDWGKPEALMTLAFARSMMTPPDLVKAREEAQAALQAVPDWSYVRDTLLPQIEQKAKPEK